MSLSHPFLSVLQSTKYEFADIYKIQFSWSLKTPFSYFCQIKVYVNWKIRDFSFYCILDKLRTFL